MRRWSVALVEGLDSFLKLDLLRSLVSAGGRPVSPPQAARELGYSEAEVRRAFRDFVALGIVGSCWREGGPQFVLAASPGARQAIDRLLNSWAGLRRTWPSAGDAGADGEAA